MVKFVPGPDWRAIIAKVGWLGCQRETPASPRPGGSILPKPSRAKIFSVSPPKGVLARQGVHRQSSCHDLYLTECNPTACAVAVFLPE